MKKILYAGIALIFGLTGQAQPLPDFSSIPLEVRQDFTARANDAALKAAGYILATPSGRKNLDRVLAKNYLIKWFMGTPDFNFVLGSRVKKLVGKNDALLLLYTAGVCAYALENRTLATDAEAIQLGGVQLMIHYINNRSNQIKITGELGKLLHADAIGRLREYLQ